MKNLTLFSILLVVAIISAGALFAAAPQPTVGPKMLLEGGDCLSDEVLAWQRLRAERRVTLPLDDSAPIVCKDLTGNIYLVSGSGKLLLSNFAGEYFTPPKEIVVSRSTVTDVQAMGVLKSGKLVIAYGDNGKLCIACSEDAGVTWLAGGEVKATGYGRVQADGVRIVQLANGTVLLPLAGINTDGSGETEGLLFSSNDEGKTWSKLGSLGPRCAGANILQLKSGELLAAITYRGARNSGGLGTEIKRRELFNNVVVARSADGGKTWGGYQCVTRFKEAPGDLSELSDGTVVLTYGQQNSPYGARAVVSKDSGKTWGSRVYILGFSTLWAEWYSGMQHRTAPGWRVSSVALKGDTILTLYTRGSLVLNENVVISSWYKTHGTLGEKGKALLSLRWTIDGMKKLPLSAPSMMSVIDKPNSEGFIDNGRRLINPEHLNEGGDYFHEDEILAYERIAGEHHVVGPGAAPIVCLDTDGNPVVAAESSIYRSIDSGRTWDQISQVPAGRTIEAFGILRDGTLLFANSAGTAVDVFRSEDKGKTWSPPVRVDSYPFDYMGGGQCYRINQMPDGTVYMTCGCLMHSKLPGAGDWDGIYRSRDGGRTWGDFSYISHPGSETNVLRLKSGKMLAAIRYQGTRTPDDFVVVDDVNTYRAPHFIKNILLADSDDDGYTWSRPRSVTRYNECPADLVEMADGTIVLSYFQKNQPSGTRGMVSRDQGKTWDTTLYMLGLQGWKEISGGHTSTVALKDGRLLTVGTGLSTERNVNLLEVCIWKPVAKK